MPQKRSVSRRRKAGTNKLSLRQRVVAAERLSKKSGGKLSTAQALKRVNKAQSEREKRIKKRK